MSKITSLILSILPSSIQQKVRNIYYENKISRVKESEEADLIIVTQLVNEGDKVLDVGSNFGLYTKFLSEYVGKSGEVHAFEPITTTFKSLENNVKYLKLDNTFIYNLALSNKSGQASMEIPTYEDGSKNMYEARIIEGDSSSSQKVTSKKLDDIFDNHFTYSFIKIDVEGHEIQVLIGGKSSIEKSKPILLIEINGGIHKDNENAQSIVQFLKELGYTAYTRQNDQLIKVSEDLHGFNYFFLTQAHIEKNNELILN